MNEMSPSLERDSEMTAAPAEQAGQPGAASQSAPRRRVPRSMVLILLLGALGILAYYGWGWWTVGRFVQSTDNAYVQGEITPIAPKISGYVASLSVEDNQRVGPGDELLRIESREYAQAVAAMEAEQARLAAELAALDVQIQMHQFQMQAAQADIAVAQAEQTRTNAELERARSLRVRGNVSQAALELAQASQARSQGQLSAARAALSMTRGEADVLAAQRARLVALTAKAAADLDILKVRLEDTVIRAPVAGTVGNRRVRVGQLVEPSRFLMAIVPLDTVWIEANFKETQLTHMEVGQPVEITVDSFPDTPITGTVLSMSPASGAEFSILPPQNASGNFTKIVQRIPVKIALDADHPLAGRLRAGMSAIVDVDTKAP